MFSKFFINRPIFATVISIVIVIAGLVTIFKLPIAQYPEITPPSISVTASYPGANSETIADTLAEPLESYINGVEDMIYISSVSSNSGEYKLTVTFKVGIDMNKAQTLVQNRVSQALPSLPEDVTRLGITTEKVSDNLVLIPTLTSKNNMYSPLYISNYATLNLKDELARIKGVGSVMVFGAGEYSMRIWLDPNKIKSRNLTNDEVIDAIRNQNIQVAAGQIGQTPSPIDQEFQYTVDINSRLNEVKDFEDIIIKSIPSSGFIRLKDIARVELGSKSYNMVSMVGEKKAVALGITLQPGANSLEVTKKIKDELKALSKKFPEGLEYSIPFDTTSFVKTSIKEVINTLFISILLVIITIYVFLEDWRATIIPAIVIPISIIGTFAVMSLIGVTINTLSLFGLVLAIGIVVDDSIIVVENTVRNIEDHNLSPKNAAIRAMNEITTPVIATTLVLLAVFVPVAFLGGITGQLYRQFSLTIATATIFSTINALTLSPALCSLLLKKSDSNKRKSFFFKAFDSAFNKVQSRYINLLKTVIRKSGVMIILFIFIFFTGVSGYKLLPKGFVPEEDMGYAIIDIQLPDSASMERTARVSNEISKRIENIEGINNFFSVSGYSAMDGVSSSNNSAFWVIFDPWNKREENNITKSDIIENIYRNVGDIQEASIYVFSPPAIEGLGTANGFEMIIQDKGNLGPFELGDAVSNLSYGANTQSKLQGVYSTYSPNFPKISTKVDREQSKTLEVPLQSIYSILQSSLGSYYINDMNKYGKNYQVIVQSDSKFRDDIKDIKELEVRSDSGKMIPLGTLLSISEEVGPNIIKRYNLYPSATINGSGSYGTSSGEAMELMEDLANNSLQANMGYEWTGLSYQEKMVKGSIIFTFILAITFVYLVLCAQYESWTLPLSVVLSVPLAILGTVAALLIRNMDINLYTQLGIILLIALSCKTSILISEFAKEEKNAGLPLIDAAIRASKLRFRPILMTAFTLILGVLPLVFATGAGAASRQSLGTATAGGMIVATFLLIFFVPVFFIVIINFEGKLKTKSYKKTAINSCISQKES